jgi:hypothetical protein
MNTPDKHVKSDFRGCITALFAAGCILAVLILLLSRMSIRTGTETPSSLEVIANLAEMSEAGESFYMRSKGVDYKLRPGDIPLARAYLFAHPDSSSYHILLDIRELDLEEYIPGSPIS